MVEFKVLQTATAGEGEVFGVGPAQRQGAIDAFRVLYVVTLHPSIGTLIDRDRGRAIDQGRFVHVGYLHRHLQRSTVADAVGGHHRHLVEVGALGGSQRFEIGGLREAQHPAVAGDTQLLGVGPLHRPGDAPALRVERRGRVGADRPRPVLCIAGGSDARHGRRLVHVGHRDGHLQLSGVAVVVRRLHRHLVGVVGVGVARAVVVGRRPERELPGGAEAEQGCVGAGDRHGHRVALVVAGRVGGHVAGPVLGEAGRGGAGEPGRLRLVHHRDREVLGAGAVAVIHLQRELVDVVGVGVVGDLVVGHAHETEDPDAE